MLILGLKRAVGLCNLAALFSKIKKPLQRGLFILIIFSFCQRNLKNIQTTEVYNLKTYTRFTEIRKDVTIGKNR